MNKTIKQMIINMYLDVLRRLYGTSNDKILFTSFGGDSYSDNPRQISEALHELRPSCKIIWAFKNTDKDHSLPDYVSVVGMDDKIRYYKAVATSKVWVSNYCFPVIKKGKKQFFIQTWHGDRAFKKILYDTGEKEKGYLRPESIEGFCDLAVAGSDYGERQYRTAFRYKGEILKKGTPRNDRLVSPDLDEIKVIKNRLKIDGNTKVLLYAPTFREVNQVNGKIQEIGELDLGRACDVLEEHYHEKWTCLLRAHPAVTGIKAKTTKANTIDVSSYEDIADLLLIADMLITDYSSCAGDYALLRRPMILFQSDRLEYENNDREFYFDPDTSPYLIVKNQEQLEQLLINIEHIDIGNNCEDILKFYGTHESGNAAEEVASFIVDKIDS